MNTVIGLLIITLGKGPPSSYVPINKRSWSWENFWLMQGILHGWFPFVGASYRVRFPTSLKYTLQTHPQPGNLSVTGVVGYRRAHWLKHALFGYSDGAIRGFLRRIRHLFRLSCRYELLSPGRFCLLAVAISRYSFGDMRGVFVRKHVRRKKKAIKDFALKRAAHRSSFG